MITGVMEGRQHLLTPASITQVPCEGIRTFAWANVPFLTSHGKEVVCVIHPRSWSITDKEWASLVKQCVGQAFAYEICNEPPPERWPRYWKLLRIASWIVRAAGKKVVSAGMPPAWAEKFYWEMAQAPNDVLALADGIGLHPYIANIPAQMRFVASRRAQLASYGADQPFYFTEFGVGSKGAPHPMGTTEQGQADYLVKTFTNFKQNAGRLLIAFASWFIWQDDPALSPEWVRSAGVKRNDGSFKPSYARLQQVSANA